MVGDAQAGGHSGRVVLELGPRGIRANLVAPGVTLTEWVLRNMPEDRIEVARERTPPRPAGGAGRRGGCRRVAGLGGRAACDGAGDLGVRRGGDAVALAARPAER